MKSPSSFAALQCCLLALWGVSFAVSLHAQSAATPPKNRMLTLAYMKTEPGKASDYVKLEREVWKQVHQDMVNQGRLTSWKLYVVSWPNGEEQEYDYVTMMEYPSFAHLESPYAGTDFSKVLGQAKYAELQSMTPAVRKLRRTDTLSVLLATVGWSTASNPILNVHYLRSLPGKSDDLLKSQREYFLPSSGELVKSGNAASWATTSLRYPVQLDFPYNYVSFNGYESLAQMEKDPPQAWRDKWQGARATENSALLAASRKRVKGQLWRLIDQTAPRPLDANR
ncbi:MAG: hypothetical protein Q7S40_06015 [Opitutaceae bacterium]|nr:hypothetical protein [Opitutaceae bacterium]